MHLVRVRPADEHAHRISLHAFAAHIEDLKTMRLKETFQGAHRKTGEMLVIDRVEGEIFKHIDQVRRLEDKGTLRRKQGLHGTHQILMVVDVRDDVVADDEVCLPMLFRNALCNRFSPRFCQGRGASVVGDLGDILRRIDAQGLLHVALLKRGEEESVIRPDLNHERILAERKTLRNAFGVFGEMLRSRRTRTRSEVDIILKERIEVDYINELDQLTVLANISLKGIARLMSIRERLFGKKRVRRRLVGEVEKKGEFRRAAIATRGVLRQHIGYYSKKRIKKQAAAMDCPPPLACADHAPSRQRKYSNTSSPSATWPLFAYSRMRFISPSRRVSMRPFTMPWLCVTVAPHGCGATTL